MSPQATRARSLQRRVAVIATIVASMPVTALFVFVCLVLQDNATQPDKALTRSKIVCIYGAFDSRNGGAGEGEVLITPNHPDPRNMWGASCKESPGGVERRGVEVWSETIGTYLIERSNPPGENIACGAWYISYAIIPELKTWPFSDPDETTVSMVWDTGERENGIRSLGSEAEAAADAQRSLNDQTTLIGTGAVLLIGLFTTVVWVVTGRVLRPVEAIRREMADITEHDLSRRVPVPRTRNEIAELAHTVNATLDRLEAAVEDNRRFVADASHELRTPIAALRAELEIATAHPGLTDWPTVVDAALADTHRLQQLATDLLLLARLDHHPPATTGDDTIDLTTVVREATTRHRTRHTLTTELPDQPTPVRGSRALLGRLVGNLLDNAERHAVATVTVRLTTTGHHAVLEVLDDGSGIPPEHREAVFDRFTRLDHDRGRDTGGTGLGLSIARRVATTHAGTLRATDHPGEHADGARLVATLPLAH